MNTVSVERRFNSYVVMVNVETKGDPKMLDVLREASRTLQIEVIKNERTDSGHNAVR